MTERQMKAGLCPFDAASGPAVGIGMLCCGGRHARIDGCAAVAATWLVVVHRTPLLLLAALL